MNAIVRHAILPLLFCATMPVGAAEAPPPPAVTIDCAHPALPSQAEISSLTGIENFGRAYAERSRLMQQAVRVCRRGATQVVLVRGPDRRELPQVARTAANR
ncbi:hypothetical protein M2650_15230 [Luteimonas sp. SX5]|uniref:UrcA family protein n=1 Tax=Luteimonas galliterrae TaxID=2940486 RepID=A0ABT0MM76_9GAMM|nr:hypothetical protein [Luteimonas galliterrae]MCL1635975.1 hypothetical protein [Luteimonas galliterrae]